jgi:RNA polymerase sigma factor for flagellar operon FliA
MTFAHSTHSTTRNATREAAIVNNLDLVKSLARRLRERVPASVTIDDLTSAGTIGLIEAADRFDPRRGLQFRSYAQHRIRGAMLDFLRGEDPLSRNERRCIRKSGETAASATVSLDQLPMPVMDRLLRSDQSAMSLMRSDVSAAARSLSARERRVIVFVFVMGLLNREIATRLNVNESRVSQIKTRALAKLRAAMEPKPSVRAA